MASGCSCANIFQISLQDNKTVHYYVWISAESETGGSLMADEKKLEAMNSEYDHEELLDRRRFLIGLKKWSKIVVGGALAATIPMASNKALASTAWINTRGGGGAWINGGRIWGNGGIIWGNGGIIWGNGGIYWGNSGISWGNRRGSWGNRGGSWGNRSGGGGGWGNRSGGGGGWGNRSGGGGGWGNRRGGGGSWANRRR